MDGRISIKREYDEICDKNSSQVNISSPQLQFLKCEGGSISLNGEKEIGIHLVDSDSVIKLQTVRFNKSRMTDSSQLTSSRPIRTIKKNRQSMYQYDEECESDSKIHSSRKRSFNEMMSGNISESELKNALLSKISKPSSDKSTQCDLVNRDFSMDGIASELQVMNSLFRAEMMQLRGVNRKHQRDSPKQQKLKIVKKNRNKGGTLEIVVGDICS